MKQRIRLLLASFAIALWCGITANAQTTAFTYQGRFTDSSVTQPTNGSYNMTFRLFDAATGGNQIPNNTTEISSLVSVVNGVFTVKLDFGAQAFNTSGSRFLEIQVGSTVLTPRQEITSTSFSMRAINAASADTLSNACLACVTNAQINSVDGAKVTGTVANATNATNATTAMTATNNVLKSGDTMTGVLTLPANGLKIGTNQVVMSGGNVGIGTAPGGDIDTGSTAVPFSTVENFPVVGNIAIPAANNYLYRTPKTYHLKIAPAAFVSVNPTIYEARYDDGFSSANINGLNSFWATGGTAGTVAYFIAPVNLPDQSKITGLSAQLVKNGGSLQSIVELYRSDGGGYIGNTAQLIATATTTGSGGIVWNVSAGSVNSSFNVVDNTNYHYFIRYAGEQNTQNLRFNSATITYMVFRVE